MIDTNGKYYLGKQWDAATSKLLDDTLLYDSEDLTTHAVVVGMTDATVHERQEARILLLHRAELRARAVRGPDPEVALHAVEVAPDHFFWLSAGEAPSLLGVRASVRGRFARDVRVRIGGRAAQRGQRLGLTPYGEELLEILQHVLRGGGIALRRLAQHRQLQLLEQDGLQLLRRTQVEFAAGLDERPLNIAHQGGEDEFPSNTMYAFRKSIRAGADT